MDLYAENILDHNRHPRCKESLSGASVTHKEENLSCGDELEISLKIEEGKIESIGWQGEGCAISQAAMSMLSEELEGMDSEKALAITTDNIYALLGVPIGPRRFKCALLCLHTLKNALNIFEKKSPQSWMHTVAVDDA